MARINKNNMFDRITDVQYHTQPKERDCSGFNAFSKRRNDGLDHCTLGKVN